jgi:GT2 family glycosyltransferase
VAFLDDDSIAAADWLPLLLAPLGDAQVLAVVGSVWPQTFGDPVSRAFHGMHHAEFPEVRTTLEASNNPFPLRMALVGNANMAFRREVFERIGYFDVRFGRGTRVGSGEEPDILLAVLRAGGKVVVEPAAKVFHRHSTEPAAFRRWAFDSACAHTAILTKYFLRAPSLRRAIFGYIAARTVRRKQPAGGRGREVRVPRVPFLLGSLYGPLAFLLSGRDSR